MRLIFLLARLVPYWALPLSLVFAELGIYFRRRHSSNQWACFVMSGLLIVLIILWFAFRGDIHSDQWIRSAFGVQ